MSGTTSVPPVTFGPTGPVLPTTSAVLAGVQADLNAAFGGGLNPALSTPQGQLATTQTAIIVDGNSQIGYLSNMFDPQLSQGRWQDALGRIYFMERLPALPTTVVCTISGGTGVIVPIGATAVATDGNIYVNTTAVTIPSGGTISATFACLVNGPITCPAGSLNSPYQTIPGWDSIINPAAGVLGANVETASQFEYRRQQTVAVNALNSVQAIKAAVFNVTGVMDAYVIANDTASSVTIGSVTLIAHSLWVCTSGGLSAAIAAAIWSKKPPGCDYNGSTSVVVFDTTYTTPQPQYTVKYQVATATPILMAVSIANSTLLPPGIVALVQAALVSAFTGGDGGTVARIGSTIYASRFYSPILALQTPGTAISILSLQLGISSANQSSQLMGINQEPTLTASNITVTLV